MSAATTEGSADAEIAALGVTFSTFSPPDIRESRLRLMDGRVEVASCRMVDLIEMCNEWVAAKGGAP